MKYSYIVLLIVFFATCAFKCVKADDGIGGKGGSAYISLQPKYNGTSINLTDCKVYIKYNATVAPANNVYDDSTTCTRYDSTQNAFFSNIKTGNYYFHCAGYDNSISKPVKGDLQYKIIDFHNNICSIALVN
jgi:hypothetical protein